MRQFNQYTASQVTLGSSAPVVEQKYLLWVYSSGTAGWSTNSAGNAFVAKGTSSFDSTRGSLSQIYSLSTSWSSSQKFAFEASFYTQSGDTTYVALWDFTANGIVSVSQISTTSTTATLVRSGTFTLVPGRKYGVTMWNSAGYGYITKAYLVALFM